MQRVGSSCDNTILCNCSRSKVFLETEVDIKAAEGTGNRKNLILGLTAIMALLFANLFFIFHVFER